MWEIMTSDIQYANVAIINSQLDTNKLKAFYFGFSKLKRGIKYGEKFVSNVCKFIGTSVAALLENSLHTPDSISTNY